jgi:non-canonical poly(A) RNA polymerase PAPD5/7
MDHYHETKTQTIQDSSSSSSSRRGGGQHQRREYEHVPKLINLHNEIVDFAALMAPQPSELEQRRIVTEKVKQLVLDTFGGGGGESDGGDGDGDGDNGDGDNGDGDGNGDVNGYSNGDNKCTIQVFGSQATGLQLPTSDIDFVVHLPGYDPPTNQDGNTNKSKEKDDESGGDKDETQKNDKGLTQAQKDQLEMDKYDLTDPTDESPLQKLGNALRNSWKQDLTYLEILETTRIPIVKFTHGPTNLSGDVCFNQTAGVQAADLMKRFMEAMPPLRPLTFVLKYFLAARGLNEPYSGGCGSFCIQMMIVSFLQHRERDAYNRNQGAGLYNLGALLLEFLELYGVEFNYVTTGISVRSDGFYFPKGAKSRKEHFWQPGRPFSLALENPFDLTGDVGRPSFRMQLIQRSLDVALKVLLSHVAEPAVPTVSLLATILPPNEEMQKRATRLKVLKIEEKIRKQGYKATGGRKNKRRKLSARSVDSDMDTDSNDEG